MLRIFSVFLLLSVSWAFPVFADTQVKSDFSVISVISSLFLVIVTILVLALVYKKLNLGFPGSRAIKVVSSMSLGTRERIVVIEVNGQQHLLGVTPHQINHLFSLDEPLQNGTPTTTETRSDPAAPMTFQKILESLGKKND